MKPIVAILFCLFISSFLGQNDGIWIHPNRGQWHKPILYKVELTCGEMFLEKNGFTYSLNDFNEQMSHNHSKEKQSAKEETPKIIHAQIIRSTFIGSSWKGEIEEKDSSSFYRNYFQGADPKKWKSTLKSFHSVQMKNFYPNIDLIIDGKSSNLKYSFSVKPHTNVQQISYEINGANSISIDEEGNLHIENRFGEITETKPIAWTIFEGRKKPVKINYKLTSNKVEFDFPEGFDHHATLIIDPSLTFSTFTGSTADNWGMTATPDNQGNLCAGGIVFNDGGNYPTTTGVYDISFNGGDSYTLGGGTIPGFDIAITKFNTTGTALVYSTYLGGSGNEAPHSLVSNSAGELYVLGVTSSQNFPTTVGAFDNSFNGGPAITENELYYNGADLFISKLSANGSALLASTFVGGSGTDGVNIGALNYNYGDPFRGEIIDGSNGYIYVSSTSQSSNFPTNSAAQGSLNGIQDAVVFKMNTGLNSMSWSTYFGGSGNETGNSVQLSSTGGVYVAGGTNSNTLPIILGNDLSFNGGISDGFLTHFNGLTGAILQGTFMGFAEYDQAYFVQLDQNNDVYVFGQSETAWPITAGLYGTPNSGQFIRKYSSTLSTITWTTMIGAGTGHPEISPTAFLVSDCFDIYLSGWGGTINSSYSNQALYSTTSGFTTTGDAFQTSTTGSNFYIAVLDQDASFLKYATFMGGLASSYNHVDGGTSRFDKSGRIYHAVCGACGGNNFGFTTTPGVISTQNLSSNCNLAAFKFELNKIEPIIGNPDPLICIPEPVIFTNSSANGNTFLWDFGDNSTSTETNPTHYYTSPGTYEVQLIVSDSNNCFSADSVVFELVIGDFQGGIISPPTPICPGTPYKLEAFGGANYSWSPANVLDDSTSATPIATITETTLFTVIVSDSCGADTLTLTLQVYDVNSSISADTSICIGNSVSLFATGGVSYQWSPGTYLSSTTSATPISTPTSLITYSVEITTADGCIINDSVTVSVFFDPPIPIIPDTVSMCLGAPSSIQVGGAATYEWSPNYAINTLVGQLVIVNPTDDFTYYCTFTNACGDADDSVYVDVVFPLITAGNDTTVCPNNSASLWASGGVSYTWFPVQTILNPNLQVITVFPTDTTIYYVIGMDQFGCTDTASATVSLFPNAFIQTCPDVYAFFGDEVQLSATSTTPGEYIWSPADYLSCTQCLSPIANPDKNFVYTITYTDQNGCQASDIVTLSYDGIIYIPNTFTPNGTINSVFQAKGGNIKTFEMYIFDRWGELIYKMDSLEDSWDGKYNGNKCQDGTYTWTIKYSDFNGNRKELNGHVNLLR